MHLNSELLFQKHARAYFNDGLKVLEIGPSGIPSFWQKAVNNPTMTWHTVDFAGTNWVGAAESGLTYTLTSEYQFPIESNQYDIVLSGQVIEHVRKIWTWLGELKRVTRPGGKVITINPVSWPYHECPIDCWRIFPDGIRSLAEELDLEVDLCLFDSLEKEQILQRDPRTTFIPGASYAYWPPKGRLETRLAWNKFIRRIPYLRNHLDFPIEVAYDTLSVLTKRTP